MIKVIAFDLVGVLVGEKSNVLNEIEDKLERLFGPNINDEDYITKAKEIIIDSAGTSSEEEGNPIYYKARLKLEEKRIPVNKLLIFLEK